MNNKSINYIKALTIEERVKAFREADVVNIDYNEYIRWINIRGVAKEDDILKYFETEDITAEELANALNITSEEKKRVLIKYIESEDWYNKYCEIIAKYKNEVNNIEMDEKTADFGYFVLPFISFAGEKLRDIANEISEVKISRNVIVKMLEKLSGILTNLGIKTFVWDFRSNTVDVISNEKVDDGKVLKRYLTSMAVPEKLNKFYDKYPVIARRLTEKTLQIVDVFSLLMHRVKKDYKEIEKIIGKKVLTWKSLDANQGDTHEQGNFVMMLQFDSGNIVYKPRNLKLQKVFYEFMDKICANADELLDISCMGRAIYREEYSWNAYVEYLPCQSDMEVKKFYRRFGQLCAFIYLLRGNDVHYENIIACGEYPVVIDVETLFQHLSDIVFYEDNAASYVYKDSIDSIGGTAMIPIVAFAKGEKGKGIDISALGGKEQQLPYQMLQLVGIETNNVHFEKANVKMDSAKNVPILNGKTVDFHLFADEIIVGFSNVMKVVQQNKSRIISGNNAYLRMFKGVKERHLMRATQSYAKMMAFSSHPNYNEDIANMQKMFINIWMYPYKNKKIIKAEVFDMLFGDIPIFYGLTDSNEIISSYGDRYEEYFEVCAYDKVIDRFKKLDDEIIAKQISQIKICMGLYINENAKKTLGRATGVDITSVAVLEYVKKVVETVKVSAVLHKKSNTIEWNNVIFDNMNMCWKTRGIGCGFINGSAGLLGFLYLFDKKLKACTEIIETMIKSIIEMPADKLPLPLADGVTANLYVCLLIFKDKKDDKIRQYIYYLIGIINEKMYYIKDASLLYGLSGVVLTLNHAMIILNEKSFKPIIDAMLLKISEMPEIEDDSFYSGELGRTYTAHKLKDSGYISDNKKINDYIDASESYYKDKKNNICYGLCREELDALTIDKKNKNEEFVSFSNGMSATLFDKIINGEDCREVLSKIIVGLDSGEYHFPEMDGYITVGFMYGLAGIGYSLLKFCYQDIDNLPLFDINYDISEC